MSPEFLMALLSPVQARRPKVIYNCLHGGRTVSTLFWALRYELISWLSVLPSLKWQDFFSAQQQLVEAGWVKQTDDGQLLITALGDQQPKVDLEALLPGRLRTTAAEVQQTRLIETTLLAIQAVSQHVGHEMNYFPLSTSESARVDVKRLFARQGLAITSKALVTELNTWLNQLSAEDATLFVSQLIGRDHPGWTFTQLGDGCSEPVWQLKLRQLKNWLLLVQYAANQSNNTVMEQLVTPFTKPLVAPSVVKTLTAFKTGLSPEQISQQRNLKLSTVNEHLLTAAILLSVDEFPYPICLTKQQQRDIAEAEPQQIDDWQFDRQTVVTDFFSYRLAQIWETKNGSRTNAR